MVVRIGGFENLSFFKSAVLDFYASSPWKSVIRVARMDGNFDDYPGFLHKTTPS